MAFSGKPYDFNSYAAGNKVYGGGRPMPNLGPVTDKLGYKERDLITRARRNALLARLKANAGGQFMSAPSLGGQR